MSKIERKVCEILIAYRNPIFFVVISVLAFLIRLPGLDFVSKDMDLYVLKWFNEIIEFGQLNSMGLRIGDYNVFFQFLLTLLTYIDVEPLYLVKSIQLIFDFFLAFVGALFISDIKNHSKTYFLCIYTFILFCPTIFINSSVWGQCDSIYCTFLLLTIYCLYKEKFTLSFVFYGLAFAFKLQAIFLLPFVIIYYFYKKSFSILNLLISIIIYWGVNSIGLFWGRSIWEPFLVYKSQINLHKEMWMNFPSFWQLIGNNYHTFSIIAIILTIAIMGVILLLVLNGRIKIDTPSEFLEVCVLCLWTVLLFLPAMHERYVYLLDLVIFFLAVINKKYIKYAACCLIMSCMSYGFYLFNTFVLSWHALIYFIFYLLFVYEVFYKRKDKNIL